MAPTELDESDRLILSAVSRDGRATLSRLADAAGLSISAVQARLKRLERRKVITGYRAVVSPEAVGKQLAAFMEITPLDPERTDDTPALLGGFEQIEACYSVAGQSSYMLFVRVASTRELEALARDIQRTAGVSTRTTVVLQTYFDGAASS